MSQLEETTKQRIVNKVTGLIPKLRRLEEAPKGKVSTRDGFLILIRANRYLEPESVNEFYTLLREFHKMEPFRSKVGSKTLTSSVEELIARCVRNDLQDKEITNLIEGIFEKANDGVHEWFFYMPLQGVLLDGVELEFGPHLLFQMSESKLSEVKEVYANNIARSTSAEEDKKFITNTIDSYISSDQGPGNKACIRLCVEGDQNFVRERATNIAMPVVYVLTFLAHGYLWSKQKCFIGLGSRFKAEIQHFPLIRTDMQCASLSSEWESDTQILRIDESVYNKLIELDYQELADLYSKQISECTEIEKMLRRSLVYFYNGYTSLDGGSELINYVMILESFLSPSDKVQLSNSISEGIALLLEEDCEKRIQLKRYIKGHIYSARSKIVHGKSDRVERQIIDEAQYFAYMLIRQILNNQSNWNKWDDLIEHIEKLKFQ